MASNKQQRSLHKEAFVNQYNLIVMGALVALSIISVSLLPLIAAVGLELLYMVFVPETDLFKAYVDNKYREIDEEARQAELDARMRKLNPYQRRRYDVVRGLVSNTKDNLDNDGSMGSMMIDKLNTLLDRFLRMMELLNVYEGYLNSVQPGELDRALKEVERQIEGSSGRVQRTLEERRSILGKRIDRLNKVRENHTIVRTQIHTVEDIMRLIYESSMTMSNPQGISQQIDDLLFDVEATEETVLELDERASGTFDELSEFDRELEEAVAESQVTH